MAIVSFVLKDFDRLGLADDKLEAAILGIGIEIEGKDDAEIKLNITPNRPDLLDFEGICRAVANFSRKSKPKEGFYRLKAEEPAITIHVDSSVHRIRPYIAGIVVKNANLAGNSLKYLINFTEKFADTYGRKRRKLAIGVHDLQKIKGDLTYGAAEEGRFKPLNANEEMTLAQVLSEHEKGVAYREVLADRKGKVRAMPVLRDSEKIIALIPITNSDATKVTERATSLFIDITGTSQKTIEQAATLIACSFIDSGADVQAVPVDYDGTRKTALELEYREMRLQLGKARRAIGVDISESDVVGLANKMGYVAAQYGKSVLFYLPPYRVDILNEQDIIEDLAIAYGYDRITPLPIVGSADGLAQELTEYENSVAGVMIGLGYTEAVNSILTNEQRQFEMMEVRDYDKTRYISIADAKTSSITMLRKHLMPELLENIGCSQNESMPQMLFEVGNTFGIDSEKVSARVSLAFVSEHPQSNFSEAKSIFESVIKQLGLDGCSISEHKDNSFIEGRCAAISRNGSIIGVFGELHPKVLEGFGLEQPAVAGELTLVKEIKYGL